MVAYGDLSWVRPQKSNLCLVLLLIAVQGKEGDLQTENLERGKFADYPRREQENIESICDKPKIKQGNFAFRTIVLYNYLILCDRLSKRCG